MNWQAIGDLRRELKNYVAMKIFDVFLWSRTANASALGKEDAVETADDDQEGGQRPARRIEPFGFRSRPVSKQRCLSVKIGSSTVLYLGVASDGGYGPGDLEDGETAIYSKNVPKALHAKDSGDVALESKAGQVVSANGTDYSGIKTEDFLDGLDAFLQALNDTDLPAASAGTFTTSAAIATLRGLLSTYKSAKFKHG